MSVRIKKVAWRPGRLSRIGLKSYSTIAIDVGAGAADYTYNLTAARTMIDLTNPANLSGLITSVDIWVEENVTGCRVGVFYLVSGTTYKCRSSKSIGNVTAGSKQTFPVNLPILVGDFIGYYQATGAIEREYTGGGGVLYVSGEYIDPGDSAVYDLAAGDKIGLYGQGKSSW